MNQVIVAVLVLAHAVSGIVLVGGGRSVSADGDRAIPIVNKDNAANKNLVRVVVVDAVDRGSAHRQLSVCVRVTSLVKDQRIVCQLRLVYDGGHVVPGGSGASVGLNPGESDLFVFRFEGDAKTVGAGELDKLTGSISSVVYKDVKR
jgi:hypothetical protein